VLELVGHEEHFLVFLLEVAKIFTMIIRQILVLYSRHVLGSEFDLDA
jgi:hypothetical protein